MKKNIQDYRKESILNKTFRYPEGVMTRAQWLKMMLAKGFKADEKQMRCYSAEEKAKEWVYDNRHMRSGNSNWPETKFWLQKKEESEKPIYKPVYSLSNGNHYWDITKTEYEHFKALELSEDINTQKNELSEKMEAGTATDDEINEAMQKEYEFAAKYFKD